MFVTPAATVEMRPSFGFSAVMKKLWNSICKINAGFANRIILPYITQSSSICPSAPRAAATGRRKIMPSAETATPKIIEA